jgi:hypothetical protein
MEPVAFIRVAVSHSYFADSNGAVEVDTKERCTMNLMVIPISHLSSKGVQTTLEPRVKSQN